MLSHYVKYFTVSIVIFKFKIKSVKFSACIQKKINQLFKISGIKIVSNKYKSS